MKESLEIQLNYYTPPELIDWAARFSWLSHHLMTEKSHEVFLPHLMQQGHKSPLDCSLVVFSLHGVDRATTHQIVRHGKTLGFSQESQRYVKQSQAKFYNHPDLKDKVCPSKTIDETISHGKESECTSLSIDGFYEICHEMYVGLLKQGVDKEVARRVLPEATTCSMALWGSTRGIMDFCIARMSPEAETPVRTIAAAMFDIMKDTYPGLFDNERFNTIRTKAIDLHEIKKEVIPYTSYRGLTHEKKAKKIKC